MVGEEQIISNKSLIITCPVRPFSKELFSNQ
jgi:hypothetical protein